MLASRAALADPPTFALRAGIETYRMSLPDTYSENPPQGSPPVLELEAGLRRDPDTTITLVGGIGAFEDPVYHVRTARLGARVVGRIPDQPFLYGLGFGATWSRIEPQMGPPAPATTDLSHYVEILAGGEVAHAGPLGLQLLGTMRLGAGAAFGATLGLAWDPPLRPHSEPAIETRPTAIVRMGEAFTHEYWSDTEPYGWGHWLEAEVGVRLSEHWALGAFVAHTKFTGLVPDFDGHYTSQTFSHTRFGIRAPLWIADRAFIALGVGELAADGDGGAFIDLQLGVDLIRYRGFALEATSQGSLTGLDYGIGESSFSIGVAYR
jgi:hypothetical protein